MQWKFNLNYGNCVYNLFFNNSDATRDDLIFGENHLVIK